ncbi:RNA polymerase factor sigma-54 [Ectothiorhodospiraceae bacterium 2226]|nr:RNA polymerase factor sigma-54 [Ectothiorhodospiraceae bacterium 2226]
MRQSLQLKLGQQLTMTPQLQQAIRLLQLATVDLQLEVQQALESNLMLELDEGAEEGGEREASQEELNGTASSTADRELDLDHVAQLPEELPVDSAWDDIYEPAVSSGPPPDDDNGDLAARRGTSESLRDHLLWQLGFTPFSETDQVIASTLIDSIDEDGYLGAQLEDIHQGLVDDGLEIELDEVVAVLHQIQNFDPAGVGARDLRESLLIQLRQGEGEAPETVRAQALHLLEHHFQLLAGRDYNQLMRRMKLDEEALQRVLGLIRTLNPRPGGQVASEETDYIIPDVIVTRDRDAWRVELNAEAAPRVRINSYYAGMAREASGQDASYLKTQLQEARWFIKSLQSRNETLLKVATCIVERQRAFLQHGEEAMQALVLADVAQEVGMHESTISRVTTKKYMRTPRGVFELKYFFSSHVSTASGGECSATAIRALIKKLVAAENPRKPLSDSQIAKILAEQGINVARRTVAKYREGMAIAPSNERKRLA